MSPVEGRRRRGADPEALFESAARPAAAFSLEVMSVATAPHPTIPQVPRTEHQPVPVKDAATVLLLRDEPGPDGTPALEVFMVRRQDRSGFVGGHHVFPGGVVDPADQAEGWASLCTGDSDRFVVSAARELLEESGVLLVCDRSGQRPVVTAEELATLARQVHSGERLLADICRERDWKLDSAALHLWSNWITPEGQPRRYDTRFYVAVAPDDQEAVHDEVELTEGRWAQPAEFLRMHRDGEVLMILPTVATLRSIEPHDSSDAVLRAAATKQPVEPVEPQMRREADGSMTISIGGEDVWPDLL